MVLQVPVIVPINGTSVNATSCAVSYALTQAGQGADTRDGNDNYLASLQLTVSNSALNAPITVPYTITVNNSAYTGVTQSVGLNLTDSTARSGVITGNVADYWNILWSAESNNVTVSMLLQGASSSLAPDQVMHPFLVHKCPLYVVLRHVFTCCHDQVCTGLNLVHDKPTIAV